MTETASPPRQNFRRLIRHVMLFGMVALTTLAFAGSLLSQYNSAPTSMIDGVTNDAEMLKRLASLPPDAMTELEAQQRASFLAEPLNQSTLRNLVLLHEAKKQKPDDFYDVLSAFTKRDVSIEVGAINSSLQSGNFELAMYHLDALLRANPELGKTVYPLLDPTLGNDKAADALAVVLAKNPQWRTDFMNELAERDVTSNLSYALFSRLRKQNAAIADSEFRNLFSNLIGKGEFSKAYFMWLDFLPSADLASMKQMYDGSFDKMPRNLFFDWNLLKRQNAKITVTDRPDKPKDQMLQLTFFQDKGEFYHVYQYLNLAPGAYKLTFDAMVENAEMPAGLQWRIRCAPDNSIRGQSARFKSTAPWEEQDFLFNLPDENCDTQILRLESASVATLDRSYQGRMAFDNFRIEQVRAEGENPEQKPEGQ